MSLLNIIIYPDNRLRKIAKSVNTFDKNLSQIVDNMFETMYFNEGIGLSATQVDIPLKIIVIDISQKKNNPIVIINPELLKSNIKIKKIGIKEGCLSIPNHYGFVLRDEKITLRYLDHNGNLFKIEAENILSICIQHEMDHLIGKLYIDYLSRFKRQRIKKKMEKLAKLKKKHI